MTFLTDFLAQPLVRYLLTLGVFGVVYAWVWMTVVQGGIGGMWVKTVKKGNLGTFLTTTIGHGLLALAIVSAGFYTLPRMGNQALIAGIGGIFFWMVTISDLFEDHAPSAAREKQHTFIVVLRMLLLAGWAAAIVAGIMGALDFLNGTLVETRLLVGRLWSIPYLGIALGIFGVYGLFRSIFKAIFGTIGVFGLIAHPRTALRDVMSISSTFSKRPITVAAAVLAIVSVLVYARSLGNDFVIWDDDNLVFDNPIVVSVTPATVLKAFVSYDPELYVPLTILSYQVERMLFGFNPFFFHLTNLVLHIGCCVGVFALLRKLKLSDGFALAGAMIFALHPLNVESVAWVSARKDLLCTFFSLLSLLAYSESRDGKKHAWILSIAFVLLALLSKATAVVIPALMLLMDWKENRTIQSSLPRISPHAVLGVLFMIIALFGKTTNLSEVSLLETMLLGFKSFAFSLKQFFFPTDISILYLQLDAISLINWSFSLSVGLFAILIISAIYALRYSKAPLFALCFYLLSLLPSFANFSKAGVIFFFSDRYVYLAQVGLVFWLLSGLKSIIGTSNFFGKRLAMSLGIVVIALFGFLSFERSLVWASSESLYRDALSKNERSVTIHYNLGRLEQQRGNQEEAQKHYDRAIELDPNYVKAWINMGMLRREQGDTPEALELWAKAAEIDRTSPEPHNNIGSVLMDEGKVDLAIAKFRQAIAIDPEFAQAHLNLADAYGKKGMFQEGLQEYRAAFALDPRLRELYPEAAKLLEAF